MASYGVRQTWEAFKASAATLRSEPHEKIAFAALGQWASHEAGSPASPTRAMREALAMSVSGAALVDAAVEKLASQGRYTPEEREYLLELNAEAALSDLGALLKTSGAFSNAFASPTVRGAIVGGGVGAGIGAWKDDENRLRGAALYGIPGAAIGAVAGHGYGSWQEARRLAADEQSKRLADEAAQAAEKVLDTHDWNYKLQQGMEWAKAQDASYAQGLKDQVAEKQIAQDAFNISRMQPDLDRVKAQEIAKRWYRNALRAAAMHASNSKDPHASEAAKLYKLLNSHARKVVEHAVDNPGKLPEALITGTNSIPAIKKILGTAQFLQSQRA